MSKLDVFMATVPPHQRDRAVGAVVAAAMAAVVSALGILSGDAPWVSVTIGPAAISGWLLGVRPTSAVDVSRPAVEIACLVSMITIGLATHGDLSVWVLGLVIAGIPLMMITVPCGLLWALVVGRVVRNLVPRNPASS